MRLRIGCIYSMIWISFYVLTGCSSRRDLNPIDNPDISVDTFKLLDCNSILSDPAISDTALIRIKDKLFSESKRFKQESIIPIDRIQDVKGIYRTANNYIGQSINLNYTFTAIHNDTLKRRPFIMFMHEGAFLYGSMDNELGKAHAFAQRGFAAASINYRLGFNGGQESNICGSNKQEIIMAIYRSVQDGYAALGYFLQRSKEFGIDESQIFLAGSSAGAIAIAAMVYMNESDFEALEPGIVKLLGKLDPCDISSRVNIRALLTNTGFGLLNSTYITKANARPTLFFQRSGDNILPYEKGNIFFCPLYPAICGAKTTSEKLKDLKIPFELNFEPEQGHNLNYSETYVIDRYIQFIGRIWSRNKRQVINERYKVVSDQSL
ncbi:alpha/beta hydrolase [Dyadobacter flavalbus]|nr:alpha/beta hydrolase fold domain-containing protein [Dyadobacter flavalbus]